MKRLSMGARDELVAAAALRYAGADRNERGRILDELTPLAGLHRKHAACFEAEACADVEIRDRNVVSVVPVFSPDRADENSPVWRGGLVLS